MTEIPVLRTARLLLRGWHESDRESFARLNADPEVMAHFPARLTRSESDALADSIAAHFATYGFGPWAAEVPGAVPFAGFIGLSVPTFEAHFTPCVEIGWRLARATWGIGYATEGATAALDFAFARRGLAEVVSFTVLANLRSRAVMQRLGMRHTPADDFDHPNLPVGHPLRRHCLYRINREQWQR